MLSGYPKFSRSINGGVRFGVPCGPQTARTLAAHAARIGGAGGNRTDTLFPELLCVAVSDSHCHKNNA